MIGFSGSIVPAACNCVTNVGGINIELGAGWGCLLQVLQQLINFAIYLGVILAVAAIAHAGFTWIMNPVNPEGINNAKRTLTNAGIGLIIALASWLIVNTLFTTLTKFTLSGVTAQAFVSGGNCLPGPVAPPNNGVANYNGSTPANTGIGGTTNNSSIPLQGGPGACDPSTVMAGAAAGGYQISQSEANTLACIAGNESGCGANINQPASSAGGAYQVLLQTNSVCYDNPACESAVGANGPLNCASGFSGGHPINGGNTVSQTCYQAAANTNCAAAAAACLVSKSGNNPYQPWASSAKNQACAAQYGGG